MSEWKFDRGIVASKPISYTQMIRRFYYVRYKREFTRRLFVAVFIYGIDQEKNTDNILDWATGKTEGNPALKSLPKNLLTFNRITSIMDFDVREKDQQPKQFTELETDFDEIRDDIEDEENPVSLIHFEKYLGSANYEKCICTLTNDEESMKRIKEIVPLSIQG